MNRASSYIAILLFFLSSAALVLAQSTGSVKGQVTDPTGAVVVNATVTAQSPNGKTVSATTDRQGVYEIKNLAPGAYDVSITAKGFAKFTTEQLAVEAGKTQQFDVSLEIAVAAEKVTVEDTNTQVDVSSSNNASSIVLKGKDLDALSDDPDDLQSDLEALAGPSAGPNGGQIYIDGFSNGQLPPKSAIREVRINTNPFSAEFDHIGYGRIQIFTKPGSDKFHGQAMFNFNNEIFNARNPFNHGTQPGYQSTMYNANVGGPLSKRASFFFNVQRRQQDETSVINAVVLDNNLAQTPFSQAIPTPVTRTEISPRVDYQLTKDNTLTARYQRHRDARERGGISTFTLPTQATTSSGSEHDIQISDTQVISPTVVNETRFQFERESDLTRALYTDPAISVLGAFTGGGNSVGRSQDRTDNYELQNNTRMTRGRHLVSFGGRLRVLRDANSSTAGYNGAYTFSSISAYQVSEMALAGRIDDLVAMGFLGSQFAGQSGLTLAQVRAGCMQTGRAADACGASQFTLSAGTPAVIVAQADAGVFAEDTWAFRRNMTLTSGLRFETQNNIPNHFNFAPRVGFAWGLGNPNKGASKTVLRLGAGIFYDRFGEGLVMQAERLNGTTQQQYIIPNPDCYPDPLSCPLTGAQAALTTYRIAPDLHAPYIIQGAATLERQMTKASTLSVTYLHSKGVHQLLTHNINAPLPDTGVRPLGGTDNVYEYFSEGTFKQDQIITNANIRIGSNLSLNSFYVLSWANGNSSGANSFPVNQYSLANEYGRTAYDVRQRFFIAGTVSAPLGIRLNPFVIVSSSMPFNITLGQDLNGDSIFNDRPTFATDLSRASVVNTRWGVFDMAPLPGQAVIPVNFGSGSGHVNVNLRVSKVIGFGPSREAGASGDSGDHGPRGGHGPGGDHGPGGGRPGGGMIRMGGGPWGGGGTAKRYNLTFSVSANNVLNHVNLASPVGNMSSPLFGKSNAILGGFGGAAANRRVMMQVMFGF